MKLYDISFPTFSTAERAASLYRQGNYRLENGLMKIEPDNYIDLGTYFNAFSIKKWMKFTHLKSLRISLEFVGKFVVEFYGMNREKEEALFFRTEAEDTLVKDFSYEMLSVMGQGFDLLGVKLTAKDKTGIFTGGSYFGEFENLRDVKIGITICTFKREKYLLPNLEKLKILTDRNPDFSVMVIDNGQTLEEKNTDTLQIMHNRNFGGAGGFTRGLIEQVNQGKNTHIILSDDDTVIELTSYDRLYMFLRGLKEKYHENFFAGAMLSLDEPTEQVENTASWKKTWLESFGSKFDLSEKKLLCENENPPKRFNVYAAWWFCCIPVEEVDKTGYPLPVFVKCDDVEYGLRHGKDFLSLNGVGVWHEAFIKKVNPAIEYFTQRNTLIVHHFANGCDKYMFLIVCFKRILHCIRYRDGNMLRMIEFALRDLEGDLEGIVSLPSDEKFAQVRNYPLTKNAFGLIFVSSWLVLKHFWNYEEHDRNLKNFVKEKLSDQKFWCEFLGISGK